MSQFKLLGVILDNKLNFNLYVAQQCLIINRKLFSIKRLFYLPQATKLQFFKAFLLPYFDYGLSLSIYYHNSAIRKLCKSYYLCLKNLFRFSFLNLNSKFGEIKSNILISNSLKDYGLFSFHHRLVLRLVCFLHKILFAKNSPKQLKNWLTLVETKMEGVKLRSGDSRIFTIDKSCSHF